MNRNVSLCILIPCFNEERGVSSVVHDFRHQFPQARIVVVDNGSTDETAALARQSWGRGHGGACSREGTPVLTAFSEIDSDISIMVDGDDSYPAEGAQRLFDEFHKERAQIW